MVLAYSEAQYEDTRVSSKSIQTGSFLEAVNLDNQNLVRVLHLYASKLDAKNLVNLAALASGAEVRYHRVAVPYNLYLSDVTTTPFVIPLRKSDALTADSNFDQTATQNDMPFEDDLDPNMYLMAQPYSVEEIEIELVHIGNSDNILSGKSDPVLYLE